MTSVCPKEGTSVLEHMAPARINPKTTGDYLEQMTKSVFQTGISWQVVDKKWPQIREAFDGFDAAKVAGYGLAKLDALTEDTRVVRNRKKLEAIFANARTMVALEREHGSFKAYLRSHPTFDDTLKDLRKRFKYLGDIGGYHFLYVVGEDVPEYETFCTSHHLTPMGGK